MGGDKGEGRGLWPSVLLLEAAQGVRDLLREAQGCGSSLSPSGLQTEQSQKSPSMPLRPGHQVGELDWGSGAEEGRLGGAWVRVLGPLGDSGSRQCQWTAQGGYPPTNCL